MKKIAVFDLDGTVYTHTWTFEVAKAIVHVLNLSEEQEKIDKASRVANERASTESYWVYNAEMLSVFERVLPRVSPAQLGDIIRDVLEEKGSSCYAYSLDLIRQMKSDGRELIAISGSINDIVEPFAKSLGFDIIIASGLEMVDGAFTGKRATQTKTGKDTILRNLVEERGLTLDDSIGVGDTHRDISFLQIIEHPIAFNPNAALYDEASVRGWRIVIERKNMIFELVKSGDRYVVESARPIHDDGNREKLR